MKFLKILLVLFLIICNVSVAQARAKKETPDYKLEYLNLNWWQKYNDPILTDYLTTAYKNNQDLKVASLNVQQSQQVVKEAFAQQLPHLGFQGNMFRDLVASNYKLGNITVQDYNQSNFMLPLTANYEVDIWGENYLKTKSIKKQVEMIRQDEHATYIALTSAVAGQYFNLVKLDKLIKNQQQLVDLQTKLVYMTEKKYQNGLCPVMEVIDEKQLLTRLQQDLNSYTEKRLVVSRELGVLTGEREKDLSLMKRGDYSTISLIPLPESISAETIKYRPDMLKVEDYIEKIGIDVKVARRDFLPKFLLYGQVGFSAYALNNIFGNHTFKSLVGFMPSLDLFTGGAKMAHLRYQKLELEKAQQMYEKTILTSIQEINNSMSTANAINANYKESLKRYDLEKDKYRLSDTKYNIGAKSNMENLRAKEEMLMAEQDEVSTRVDYLISTLNIYKAVGGRDFTTINDNL